MTVAQNICPHCYKGIPAQSIKCLYCAGLVEKDHAVLRKIVEDFGNYLVGRQDSEGIGILLGIPESYLPYKKVDIEQALEFFMLAYAVEFLRTGSFAAEAKFNLYENNYLSLIEYFPDKEIPFYEIVISPDSEEAKSRQFSEKLKDEQNVRVFESWTKHMYNSEERYYEKVKQIKVQAEALKDKIKDAPS